MAETVSNAVGMVRMGADTEYLPRSLFGQNLEHTRSCIYQGLSAQLIRNRKFAGKPSRDGVASEWLPWGEGMFYEMLWKSIFLKHETSEYGQMPRRNECFTQGISNYGGTPGGIRQTGLALSGGEKYTLRIAWRNGGDKGTVETLVKLSGNGIVFLQEKVSGITSDWSIAEFHFSCECDADAELSIGLDACGSVWLGMVSLMSDNNFRGMRPDVIAHLKAIGTSLIRWPGGNFAGEYLWRDGLLPADERKPSQSFMEIETQPYTNGFDYNELGTDDIIALCREIGAQPFITLNPTWNTPEESAQWVEYCNGDENTPYGKLRAERGHSEPYNVRFWSLGNEAGYGHMEGANTAEGYAKVVREHAEQMLKVTPDLILCSSGPYPNQEWVNASAKAMADIVPLVSLHNYTGYPSYMDPATRGEEYTAFIREVEGSNLDRIHLMREQLGDSPVQISFDEWNAWYAWYRPGSVTEGIFVASFMNMLFRNAERYNIGLACHFESVNEGSIMVHPHRVDLAPAGQAFSLMKHHAEGLICALEQDVVATRKGSVMTCTLINRSYDHEKRFTLEKYGKLTSAVLYASDDVVPGSEFTVTDLPVRATETALALVLPGHSIAQLQIQLS